MPEKHSVALLAHSGCDMPSDKARDIGFSIIPDVIIFGSEQYRNNVDISCQEFYRRLESSRELPTSSHPSIGDFIAAFEDAAREHQEILCMAVTGQMSGTYSTAVMAKKLLEEQGFDRKIYVFDTRQVSHGMGLMMREASRLRQTGLGAQEIMARLEREQKNIGVYFVLESLKNARKGGRVGAIKALAADTLGIKPLLTFQDGTVSDIGVARCFEDGMDGIVTRCRDEADLSEGCIVFHADNDEAARRMAARIRRISPRTEVDIEYVGSVIGVYTGRGCVGVAFRKKR